MGKTCVTGIELYLGNVLELDRRRWVLHNVLNVLKATETLTLRWLVFCEFFTSVSRRDYKTFLNTDIQKAHH